ncbi:MAG: HEAT repeat domain-containing protein [Phycisphaerales bacterium]|nr:HEAT repeat domain-containing protein [Phycisphaerales bacterium]
MTHDQRLTFGKAGISLLTSASICLSVGCGAEIRPDGNKRVVFNEQDGSQRVIEITPDSELRRIAIDNLMRMTEDPSPEVRANAIEALSTVSTKVEPIVALALTDQNVGVKTVAIMVAGKAKLSSLSPSIRELTQDSSPFVRSAALYALGSFGEQVDLTELSSLLFEHTNPRVRSHVAYILGELGDTSAVPMLQQATFEPITNASNIETKIYRLQLAEALIKLGAGQNIDTVRAALYPSRPEELETTALAVQIIGQVHDESSIDQLIYLSDENADIPMPAEVRLGVAISLAQMGHREGAFIADEYFDSEISTVRALSAVVYGKTKAAGNLGKLEILMVNDASPLTRVAAAGAIVDYTQNARALSDAK